MSAETRERFPITNEAVRATMELGLEAAAPHIISAWIDALTDEELCALRFPTRQADWAPAVRAQLKKLAEVPA